MQTYRLVDAASRRADPYRQTLARMIRAERNKNAVCAVYPVAQRNRDAVESAKGRIRVEGW